METTSKMTIGALIMAGVISDTDQIRVVREVAGQTKTIASGEWYMNSVLECMDVKIHQMFYTKDRGWKFTLDRIEV